LFFPLSVVGYFSHTAHGTPRRASALATFDRNSCHPTLHICVLEMVLVSRTVLSFAVIGIVFFAAISSSGQPNDFSLWDASPGTEDTIYSVILPCGLNTLATQAEWNYFALPKGNTSEFHILAANGSFVTAVTVPGFIQLLPRNRDATHYQICAFIF
jgi:hypothetical protein